MTAFRLLYVTCPDADVAERLARTAVEESLAACANILPGMRSIYRWRGAVETAQECVLILKCDAARADACQARIAELHPYEVPCVLQIGIAGGHQPYLDWLSAG